MPHIPRAVCVEDGAEMLICHTGATIEMVASWGSYYKVNADMYQCPICQNKVALLAEKVIIESYNPSYANVASTVQARFADAEDHATPEETQRWEPIAARATYAHDAHCNTKHTAGPQECPPARDVVLTDELPGMWESSDFTGGLDEVRPPIDESPKGVE